MLYATIMAGGSGTRFWPASRQDLPKQLLNLVGRDSMLQATVQRLDGLCSNQQILILTNQRLVAATKSQLPALPSQSIIGEPCKRDTAPCIGLAASLIAAEDPDAHMLVMPADHIIQQVDKFHAAVNNAVKLLDQDPTRIITFGIQPTYAAQVFGYIERDEPVSDASVDLAAFRVKQFREKPDQATAESFIDSGNFYWNSGIFLWRARTILEAMRKFEPQMMLHIDRIAGAAGSADFDKTFSDEFAAIAGKSIDFAVMEHYENVCVLEAPFDWDDVGNWTAVPRLTGTDANQNSVHGKHLAIDSSNCIIRSTDQHLIVTLGLKDCIVVHTPDATLVADRHDESAIKKVVSKLESLGWDEYL